VAQYKETSKNDWVKTIVYVAVFIAVLIGSVFLLWPAYWYLWFLVLGAGVFLLVLWHNQNYAYRCSHCGHGFEISLWVDFISPQGINAQGGWKYLKCPACRQRTKAIVLKKA
jgi:hypothetical protein